MVEVLVAGSAFREKVRMAVCLWARLWPHEVAKYKRDMKMLREKNRDAQGHWNDKDMVSVFRDPPHVPELLGMTEWASKFRYGVPCGTGNPRWAFNPELSSIFESEICDGFTSTLRGGTSIDKDRTPE